MDFFETQEVARRKTGRLVVLFALAVAGIVASVYLVVAGALLYAGRREFLLGDGRAGDLLADPLLIAIVVMATLLIVGGGSLYKMAALRGGGRVVAESLGGRMLLAETTDPGERRLLNVVEEMAIASGTPVPPVYLLEREAGINAFAAGYAPRDAVIGVSRGAVDQLSRDELQGVIAHEFSHVLSGDMRLNIRLVGVLHGILMIGMIGYFVLRSMAFAGHRSGRRSGGGNAVVVVLIVGAGLAAIGFIGTFFGNWIKAAVSRQREYLADASAVQFTRNPDGIAGALKRIGGLKQGAKLESPNAPQASHMFFGQAVTSGLHAMFATHPPLEDRVRRIDPGWDGTWLDPRTATASGDPPAEAGSRAEQQQRRAAALGAIAAGAQASAVSGVAAIGRPTPEHVARARALLDDLPPPLVDGAGDAHGARAVVYALLIDEDPEVRGQQRAILERDADPEVAAMVGTLLPAAAALKTEGRLPLFERLAGPLRELSPGQHEVFAATVDKLVRADRKLGLLEWTLQRILMRHLAAHFGRVDRARVRHYGLAGLKPECETILSLLARAGHRDEEAARAALAAAAPPLELGDLRLLPLEQCRFSAADRALDALAALAPRLKRRVVEAAAACITADRAVAPAEAEILRAICESLGCPMPPLLPGQSLA